MPEKHHSAWDDSAEQEQVDIPSRLNTNWSWGAFCRSLLWIQRRAESNIYKFPVATVMPKKGGMQVENTEEQLQKDVICQGRIVRCSASNVLVQKRVKGKEVIALV